MLAMILRTLLCKRGELMQSLLTLSFSLLSLQEPFVAILSSVFSWLALIFSALMGSAMI